MVELKVTFRILVTQEGVVEVQPPFCLNEVGGGTRHQNCDGLRQCVDEVDPKLEEPSSSKLQTLQET